MRKPLLISAGLHAAVIISTLVAFQFPRKLTPVEERVLPVELLTIAEMTNLKRQAKEIAESKPVEKPKPEETPEPPKPLPEPPKPEPTPEPAPPEPEQEAEPIPDKTAEKPEEKKPEPKPEKPKVAEKKEEKKPKKPAFDPTNIKALLDKMPDKSAQKDVAKKATEKANSSTTDDNDSPLSMSEEDAIRQHINKCWNVGSFSGSPNAATLYALVHIELNQDGTLNGPPELRKAGGGSFSRAFAESALRAIRSCEPYNFLPQDKFNSWKSFDMNFTLSGML